jgi:hypothetical protein
MTTPIPPIRPRKPLEPIDPDSEHGKRVALALGELFDEIADGLRRDGQPVPDCISPPLTEQQQLRRILLPPTPLPGPETPAPEENR